jgi:hypothetical protein
MELISYEKAAIQQYISAIGPHRSPKDMIRDCRQSVIHILQSICKKDFNLSDTSKDFENPREYVVKKMEFFSTRNSTTGKWEPRSDLLNTVYKEIGRILEDRVISDYKPGHASLLIMDEDDSANQCKNSLKAILKWYFNHHHSYQLSSISNLSYNEKSAIDHLFTGKANIQHEVIIQEGELYYVILLVDSSQSMLWPYLNEQSNRTNVESTDYKNAVKQVQEAMRKAHEKALTALKGSAMCKDRYMKLYQYIFNQKNKVLNAPEELKPVGNDKVVKIDSSNYTPQGATALYDTLEESINVIYDDYLKLGLEKDKIVHKVVIGLITDGEDTYIDNTSRFNNPELYERKKEEKIKNINTAMKRLRGNDDLSKCFLASSVLIGLTGNDFSETKLKEIKKELSFDEYISINQSDEQSIRKAFKLFSTNAINV